MKLKPLQKKNIVDVKADRIVDVKADRIFNDITKRIIFCSKEECKTKGCKYPDRCDYKNKIKNEIDKK